MEPETPLLNALREAMDALRRAEEDRTRTWAWTALGLVDGPSSRQARMQAEQDVEAAHERLTKARLLLARSTPIDEKAWSGH